MAISGFSPLGQYESSFTPSVQEAASSGVVVELQATDDWLVRRSSSEKEFGPRWAPLATGAQLRLVAPGIAVPPEEYEIRFGHLPLDDFRERMDPKTFLAYVRFVGSVRPMRPFDAVTATRMPELDAD